MPTTSYTADTVLGTIRNLGVPYRLASALSLDDGSSIDVEPGTDFVVEPDVFIEVGPQARLTAIGTEEQPIVFRGVTDRIEVWQGIVFRAEARAESAARN